jgi:hypothetical protein
MIRTIQCKPSSVKLDLGLGNRLILFQGDKISVNVEAGIRGKYRVFDIHGQVIGHLTIRDLRKITGEPLRREKGEEDALVPQR